MSALALVLAVASICPGLSKPEHRWYMHVRNLIQERLDVVQRYVTREARDISGGVSIEDDCARRPYVLVRLTRDRERHEAALKRLFPYELRTAQVPRTLAELGTLRDRISADSDALKAEGFTVSGVGPDIATNMVHVELITRREDAPAFFAARYGPVRVTAIAREPYRLVSTRAEGYSVSRTGRSLRLRWTTNSVYKLVRVEVRETARRVSIRIVERAPTGPVTLIAAERRHVVRLRDPLGDRQVFDATSGRRLKR